MKQKTIYFIRHGETDHNRNRIVQGWGVDTSLNDTGRNQARAFYSKYAQYPFEVVLTSRLKRTHETVAPFLETRNLPWEQFIELNEMNWGSFEGKNYDDSMHRYFKEITGAWAQGHYHVPFADGESALDLAARLSQFLDHLVQRPEEQILVCSHGRALRCLVCLLKKEPLSSMEKFHHSNTGLYLAHYDGEKFEFELENDLKHLKEPEQY